MNPFVLKIGTTPKPTTTIALAMDQSIPFDQHIVMYKYSSAINSISIRKAQRPSQVQSLLLV